MKKRLLCTLLAALCLLTACKKVPEPVEFSTFAMNTFMSFTFYGKGETENQRVQDQINVTLRRLDSLFSVNNECGDVNQINRSKGQRVEVDAPTVELLVQALELCEITDGALDITAYPAVRAWGFTQEEYRVPSPAELAELTEKIDYTVVELGLESHSVPVGPDGEPDWSVHAERDTVTLPAGMELDLGAVAKGFAGDQIAASARGSGITSALLNLGQSTIAAVGAKPDGSPWRVGIRDPEGEGYFAVVELTDMAMGTSGGYQRYFEQDEEIYWHILDPDTAAPAKSGLSSVTVVSPSALTCDGLSTALFVMGLEKGTQFWRDHPELEFEAVFLTEEGGIYRTAGLEGRFSLAEGYEDREVTVLE